MLSANTKFDIVMQITSLYGIFWKRARHKYAHIYAYIYVKSSLPNAQCLKLALALQPYFLEWRLTHFGKDLFIST